MKAIVFGGTGFIGSHVVEQLNLAGHEVTIPVRDTSNTAFLENFGVHIVRIDFSNSEDIKKAISGHEVVYNCTANEDPQVEIELTRMLIEAAATHGVSRFIQLSTIVIYDFLSDEPIDESYISQPEYPRQNFFIRREKIINEISRKTGVESIIVRPASTIGTRDISSFFAKLYISHVNNQYPLVGKGTTKVSLIDTRDIGRAMVWLGSYKKPEHDNGIYLLKGFDTTWYHLKKEIDKTTGRIAKTVHFPENLTDEQMIEYRMNPLLMKTFSVNRLWNDRKIRNLGFKTKYSLTRPVTGLLL